MDARMHRQILISLLVRSLDSTLCSFSSSSSSPSSMFLSSSLIGVSARKREGEKRRERVYSCKLWICLVVVVFVDRRHRRHVILERNSGSRSFARSPFEPSLESTCSRSKYFVCDILTFLRENERKKEEKKNSRSFLFLFGHFPSFIFHLLDSGCICVCVQCVVCVCAMCTIN